MKASLHCIDMARSVDFHEHAYLLHDSLCSLLGRSAIEVAPGQMLGAGLLRTGATVGNGGFRSRLLVATGLANVVGNVIQEDVPDDLLVIGRTRDDDPDVTFSHFYAASPGVAKDMHKNVDLDDWQIVMLSHSASIAGSEPLATEQAYLYYQKIAEKLCLLQLEMQT